MSTVFNKYKSKTTLMLTEAEAKTEPLKQDESKTDRDS